MKLSPKEILIPAVALLLICFVATTMLALTNGITAGRIADIAAEKEIASRKVVLPAAVDFEEQRSYDPLKYFFGFDKDGNEVGIVFTVSGKGYGGDVTVMVGVGNDGKVTGIEILSHNETPGLGANSTKPEFKNRFVGKGGVLAVNKTSNEGQNVQAITAATITSKAVTNAVNEALSAYAAIKGGVSE